MAWKGKSERRAGLDKEGGNLGLARWGGIVEDKGGVQNFAGRDPLEEGTVGRGKRKGLFI